MCLSLRRLAKFEVFPGFYILIYYVSGFAISIASAGEVVPR